MFKYNYIFLCKFDLVTVILSSFSPSPTTPPHVYKYTPRRSLGTNSLYTFLPRFVSVVRTEPRVIKYTEKPPSVCMYEGSGGEGKGFQTTTDTLGTGEKISELTNRYRYRTSI